jgi:hypothetical protein
MKSSLSYILLCFFTLNRSASQYANCNFSDGDATIINQNIILTPKGTSYSGDIRREFAPYPTCLPQDLFTYQFMILYPFGNWVNSGMTILDHASNLYNCHAYAWHLSEGNSNKFWLNLGRWNRRSE